MLMEELLNIYDEKIFNNKHFFLRLKKGEILNWMNQEFQINDFKSEANESEIRQNPYDLIFRFSGKDGQKRQNSSKFFFGYM